jgi:G3E family GTPase
MNGAVDSEKFEAFLKQLPDHVYRAKGIVSFSDTASRFLFQYAYRETDFIRITPQGDVNDVAVFIGEHFSKEMVLEELLKLEHQESTE